MTSSFKFTLKILLGCIFFCGFWTDPYCPWLYILAQTVLWWCLNSLLLSKGIEEWLMRQKSMSKGRLSSFQWISSYVCNGFIHGSKIELCIPGCRGVFVVNNKKGGWGDGPNGWHPYCKSMRPEFGTLKPCRSGHGSAHVSFWTWQYTCVILAQPQWDGDRQESLGLFWPDSLAYNVVQVGL